MSAGATEPVVEVEVAKGGIEIIAPEQADHPPAEPQTFRVGGRPAQELLGLGEFVELLLIILGLGGLLLLIARFLLVILG